jgi:hypothetical protein
MGQLVCVTEPMGAGSLTPTLPVSIPSVQVMAALASTVKFPAAPCKTSTLEGRVN